MNGNIKVQRLKKQKSGSDLPDFQNVKKSKISFCSFQ